MTFSSQGHSTGELKLSLWRLLTLSIEKVIWFGLLPLSALTLLIAGTSRRVQPGVFKTHRVERALRVKK